MKARVFVSLKSGVLDPQGKAIASALHHLEYPEVADVRVGKYFDITLSGTPADAEKRLKEMSDKLLANPVIEDFRVEVLP